MAQANKAGAAKGMAVAGLVCSIVGCCLAGYQMYVINTAGEKMKEGFEEFNKNGGMDSLNKALEELRELTDTTQAH
jgi:hypothetical protein